MGIAAAVTASHKLIALALAAMATPAFIADTRHAFGANLAAGRQCKSGPTRILELITA